MLQAIKRSVASPWLRYLLFGLLVLSFGLWGIGDVLRGIVTLTRSDLVEARAFTITAERFLIEWDREQRHLATQGFEASLLRQSPLPRVVLQRMITREVLKQEARNQNILIPSSVVEDIVASNPAFIDAEGRFSSTQFEIFLQQSGLQEEGYLNLLSLALTEQALLGSLAFPSRLPKGFLHSLLAAESETRRVSVARLPLPSLSTIPDPGDPALQTFLSEQTERLRLPEMRAFQTLTLARNQSQAPQPSTEELLALFEKRKDAWAVPERRAYRQWFFLDKDPASQALIALEQGTAGKAGDPLRVSARAKAEIPDARLADALFTLKTEGERILAEGDLGWYILQLERVDPSRLPRFAEKRAALLDEFVQEWQTVRYLETLNEVEDMLLTGTPLVEIASRLRASTNTTPLLDSTGIDIEGNPSAWANREEVTRLEAGFVLRDIGAVSKALEEDEQTLYLELTELQPPRLPRLERRGERARVLSLYRSDRRRALGLAQAQSLVKQAEKTSLEAAAQKTAAAYQRYDAVGRTSSLLPAELLGSLFSTSPNTFLTYEDKPQEQYLVARADQVARPTTFSSTERSAFAERQQFSQLLLSLYREALYRQAEVQIDEQQFSSLFAEPVAP